MTNPWQNWLQAFTQTCNAATQSQNPLLTAYTQGWQQWCNATCNAWQTPSGFWQAVSAIQTARAQSISNFWQQQPQQFAALINCQTVPQACARLTQWCGSNAVQAVNLAVTTQAHRANLWQQWARAAQPQPQQGFPSPSSQPSAPLWAETPAKAAPAPATQPAARTTTSAPERATPWHMQSHYPTQHITQAAAPATVKPQAVVKPLPQPAAQQDMPLMNGTTGTIGHPTTSSTANSVMRTNGSSIASAAATRRSVVARRSTNRRRVVPRTVR